jgi:23S rRNA (cytosine1962-C5)-methyltransferase
MEYPKIFASGWEDYELIDAGGSRKLERWGKIITVRPERQAYFKSEIPFNEWSKMAHWEFKEGPGQKGTWKKLKNDAPEIWQISYNKLAFNLKLTGFKHLGIFPEQQVNWDFILDLNKSNLKVLNLFAYTGATSCIAKSVDADVIHVDSVKQLITWAAENMESSGLNGIRWVHEDALKFAQRAVKRGDKFDLVIMDPPAWGIGANKEKWKLENKLEELMRFASQLLSADGVLILNTYSPTLELRTIESFAQKILKGRNNDLSELWMKTTSGKELFYGNLLRSTPL